MTIPAMQLSFAPLCAVTPIATDHANRLLVEWAHKLGPCNRPFRQEAYGLDIGGRVIAVALSASIVSATVAGYCRGEVVELARLCAEPGSEWANRVMLRLWREVLAPAWACWPVRAAVSYHHNALHKGDLYRFDGWKRIRDDCGSSGGGAWSRKRYATDAAHGTKTLWLWRYPEATP